MSLGLFLRRELITSVRRGTAFSDRCGAVLTTTAVVSVCVVGWDWRGEDRASVAGAASFARLAFAWVVAAHAALALGLVPSLVAPGIASERDRKSLDSLLASRLSAWEVVLGTMGAGLLRYSNGLAALLPVFILMMFLGGVDPSLVLLALAGIASTAIALAALSAAVSAGARTASLAMSGAVGLSMAWMCLPGLVVMLLPRLWPAAVPWLVPAAVRLLDSSPLGVALTLAGVVPRGSLLLAVSRMIVLQLSAAVLLVLWATVRLRPASRAVYDAESRAAVLRLLRGRWRPRPPCGDDPVLWHELHPGLRMSDASLWTERLVNMFLVGLLAYVISLFALPAFVELFQMGYGPAPGRWSVPEVNPIIRLVVSKVVPSSVGPAPGQARPEFNIVLRQTTGLLVFLHILMLAGAAAESVAMERERETWLGLIATPLTGREILRAKMLGVIWKTRGLAYVILALWTLGLLAGAVHPLGFVAAIWGMAVSCLFVAALGVSASLRSRDRGQATGRALGPLMIVTSLGVLPFILPGMASVLLAAGTLPFQAWASVLSYEDVHAAFHSREIPQFAAIGATGAVGPGIVAVAWLIGTAAHATGAFLLTRSAARGFDAAIGRPIRARGDAHRSRSGTDAASGS